MGDSKQQHSAKVPQQKASQASASKGKVANGKDSENQLMDEVNKLDQIRDMLFGEHVETLQTKYQTLDKSLDKNISVLRKELTTSIAELKQQIDQRFDQLQKHLQSEQADRVAEDEQLNSSLSRVNSDILTKIDLEAKRMDQALNDQHEEARVQLNSMVDSLQDEKVDRKSLAALFSQFAKELEGS